jgi:Cdc6-like AAA superfamily ATPase
LKDGLRWQVENESTLSHPNIKEKFHFDSVFRPEETTESIFYKDIEPMMGDALKGNNVTICTYGQTGSGKTHTMSGQ